MVELESGSGYYATPRINLQVSMGPDGSFSEVLSGPSCIDKEQAREALRVLGRLPPDKRAVWVKRLDLDATLKNCPAIRNDQQLSKELSDLVEAYRGPGAT